MKLKDLIAALQHFSSRGYEEFDVVVPGPQGAPEIRELGVSVGEPEEKLIAIGCDGFVLREDL